jgi:transposase
MAAEMIGVDPHKGSHTAVAIGAAEEDLGQFRVLACAAQAQRLLAWAEAWPERTWAVGGAGGLGHLLNTSLSNGAYSAEPGTPQRDAHRPRTSSA